MALSVEQLQQALAAGTEAVNVIRDTQGPLRRIESGINNLKEATLAEVTGAPSEDRQRLAFELLQSLQHIPEVLAKVQAAMEQFPAVAEMLRDGWEPPSEDPEGDD
jgi:hypothetical protein